MENFIKPEFSKPGIGKGKNLINGQYFGAVKKVLRKKVSATFMLRWLKESAG